MQNFDFSKNFISIRKDVNKISNVNSLLESIENIIMMNAGDVVGNNKLGSQTRQMLFQQNTYFVLFSFVKQIEFAIKNYEPRIENVSVTAKYNKKSDVLELTVTATYNSETIKYQKKVN